MAARHRKEPQWTKDWKKHSERQPVGRFWEEVRAAGDDKVEPRQDWDAAVCACFRGLLKLSPRPPGRQEPHERLSRLILLRAMLE